MRLGLFLQHHGLSCGVDLIIRFAGCGIHQRCNQGDEHAHLQRLAKFEGAIEIIVTMGFDSEKIIDSAMTMLP